MLLVLLEEQKHLNDLHRKKAHLLRTAEKIFDVEFGNEKAHYYKCRDDFFNNNLSTGQRSIYKYLKNTLSDI